MTEMPKKEPKWYVVFKGVKPGIYDTWEDTKKHVDGFSGAVYKSFKTPRSIFTLYEF